MQSFFESREVFCKLGFRFESGIAPNGFVITIRTGDIE